MVAALENYKLEIYDHVNLARHAQLKSCSNPLGIIGISADLELSPYLAYPDSIGAFEIYNFTTRVIIPFFFFSFFSVMKIQKRISRMIDTARSILYLHTEVKLENIEIH